MTSASGLSRCRRCRATFLFVSRCPWCQENTDAGTGESRGRLLSWTVVAQNRVVPEAYVLGWVHFEGEGGGVVGRFEGPPDSVVAELSAGVMVEVTERSGTGPWPSLQLEATGER